MNNLYKEFCIWPYNDWDIIEVLICSDIDDWSNYEPNTEYYYVWSTYITRLSLFRSNTTWLEIDIPSLYWTKTVFWFLWDRWEFDSSYVLSHRKVETEHWYNAYHICKREPLIFSEPT